MVCCEFCRVVDKCFNPDGSFNYELPEVMCACMHDNASAYLKAIEEFEKKRKEKVVRK